MIEDVQTDLTPLSPHENEPTHSSSELPSIDEAMKATWARLKERLLPLAVLSAVPIVFSFLLSLIGFITLYGVAKMRPDLTFIDIIYPAGTIAVVCGIIIFLVISTWSTLALFILANHPVLLSLRDAFRMARTKVIGFWGVALMTLIIAGSYIFFIIPGLILSIFFAFSIFTFLVEDEQGMNALVKSREYVRGHFWKTFGYIMIPVLIAIILSLIIGLLGKVSGGAAAIIRLVENILLPAFSAVYFSIIFNRYRLLKPHLVLSNTTGQKTLYLVIGILGWALLLFIALSTLSYFSQHPEQLQLLKMAQMVQR